MEEKVTRQQAKQIYYENNKRVVDENSDGFVVLKDINKVYDNRVQAVFDFNLSVGKNEFIVLVGPSGCGKSTTLRMIAGLEEITSGYLYIDKILSNYLESKDRDIAMVFQSYALYPNMTVYDNIGFGLKVRRVPKEEIRQKVFEAAEILDLGPYLDRKPKELSGGQMQRVALGRAIVRDAKLFLMDEPLSNLDAKLRVQMRSEIVKLHKNIHATTIYVTHDQTEAMTMADRIVIMNKGLVQQTGTPMEIYNNPRNVFVATFIGNPPMNVVKADISGNRIMCGEDEVKLPKDVEKTYVQFIEERRKFFADFKEKADLTVERALTEDIKGYLAEVKKLSAEDAAEKLSSLCARLKNLSQYKNFIRFSDENEKALSDDLSAGDIHSLKNDFSKTLSELRDTDLAVAGVLKKFDSAGAFKKSESAEPSYGKKKKKEKVKEPTVEEKNAQIIEQYLNAYAEEDAQKYALVGIRPEDIHFYDDFKGKKSAPVNVTASFVELLGSEYCVYVDLFGTRIIMKTGLSRPVRTGDEVKLCFDMEKIKIFDGVSGERVY